MTLLNLQSLAFAEPYYRTMTFHSVMIIVASVTAILCCCFSFALACCHLTNYTNPRLQRQYVIHLNIFLAPKKTYTLAHTEWLILRLQSGSHSLHHSTFCYLFFLQYSVLFCGWLPTPYPKIVRGLRPRCGVSTSCGVSWSRGRNESSCNSHPRSRSIEEDKSFRQTL